MILKLSTNGSKILPIFRNCQPISVIFGKSQNYTKRDSHQSRRLTGHHSENDEGNDGQELMRQMMEEMGIAGKR